MIKWKVYSNFSSFESIKKVARYTLSSTYWVCLVGATFLKLNEIDLKRSCLYFVSSISHSNNSGLSDICDD